MVAGRLIVCGCVAQKGRVPAPARELYTSQLWKARRTYAESMGLPWRIFSAKHGLIGPDEVIAPYDATFPGPWGWREKLSKEAVGQIVGRGFREVELHAGEVYRVDLVRMLQAFDVRVLLPVEGLGIGQQLAWYAAQRRQPAAERTA